MISVISGSCMSCHGTEDDSRLTEPGFSLQVFTLSSSLKTNKKVTKKTETETDCILFEVNMNLHMLMAGPRIDCGAPPSTDLSHLRHLLALHNSIWPDLRTLFNLTKAGRSERRSSMRRRGKQTSRWSPHRYLDKQYFPFTTHFPRNLGLPPKNLDYIKYATAYRTLFQAENLILLQHLSHIARSKVL